LSSTYRWFVGVDWATEEHQICIIDQVRNVVDEQRVKHCGLAIAQLTDRLNALAGGNPESVAVSIETPRGALVETLVERGFHVYSINPKQLDRFRDRHTVAGAKDDRLDALVLADSLRTDQHCFRLVQIDDPLTIQLRELSRMEDDLRDEAIRLTNRLRDQLHRYYPQILKVCPDVNKPWLWALWEAAPDPVHLSNLRASRVEKILRAHRIRRIKAHEVLAILKEPPLFIAPGTVEAAKTRINSLVSQLRLTDQERQTCSHHIEELLSQVQQHHAEEESAVIHSDVDILRSLPGVGRIVCSTLLAEASISLRERDYYNFRALAGIARNLRLRNAVYHWARISCQCDEASRQHYTALRQKGHGYGRALRGTADRLLRILFAMLRNRTLYQPDFKTPPQGTSQPSLEAFVERTGLK